MPRNHKRSLLASSERGGIMNSFRGIDGSTFCCYCTCCYVCSPYRLPTLCYTYTIEPLVHSSPCGKALKKTYPYMHNIKRALRVSERDKHIPSKIASTAQGILRERSYRVENIIGSASVPMKEKIVQMITPKGTRPPCDAVHMSVQMTRIEAHDLGANRS